MKAVFYMGKDRVEVKQTPIPELETEEALVKVRYTGVCGSDVSIVAGKHPRAKPPLILGHEFSGELEAIRSETSDLKPGDRVIGEPLISCGTCYACRSGFAYVCQNLGLYGIDAPGSFAEYIKLPVEKLYRIPDGVDFQTAALIEPLAVAVHAVRLSSLKLGDTVCVLGAGPIGLLTAITASQTGAKGVLVCEKEPIRIGIARGFGLKVIDVAHEDPQSVVEEATGGRGADIVFEAAGAPQTVLLAPKLCCVRGEIVQIAMPKEPRPADILSITFRELTLKGVRVYAPFDFERAIDLVSHSSIDFKALLSPPIPLDRAEEAIRRAAEGTNVMRALLEV
jgi:(R,R)-butanediol dehydrogenase/meso-butanediol dehydrogenase/diacetyl reductase